MKDHGIGSWAARRARMTPDKPALVQDGRVTTYAELDARSRRLALGLRARGVGRGDRVAFLGLNSPALVETLFAAARLGAVFLPLNTRLAPAELEVILADAEPAVLLWQEPFGAAVAALPGGRGGRSATVSRPPAPGLGSGDGSAGFETVAPQPPQPPGAPQPPMTVEFSDALLAEDGPLDDPVGLEDLFMIQYTSGTSGRPKGVQLSHGNVTWNVMNLLVDVDLASDEVALVTAPLFHTAALNQVLLPTILKGGTCLVEARFDPERCVDLIESERVTLLFGVTSMYLALAQSPRFSTADLSSLRGALSGGAPLPESLLHTWLDRGLMIIQGYGLTESSPGATMLRAADGVRKVGSAGTACFFSDVRVVDADGEPVAPGVAGEVLVSGPNVTSGYWRNAEATAQALDGGWLHTGDLATVDAEGYLRIVDRLKDMFISGGENVYPAEVEATVHGHPDVAECAVIGVADERWGEIGLAVVVPRSGATLTEADVLGHLDGRLARYKIPQRVVVVDALPHNASGKLLKAPLRDRFRTEDA